MRAYYNNNVHLLRHCHLRPADFDLPPNSVICFTNDTTNVTGVWQIKIQESQMTKMPEYMNIIIIIANIIRLYKRRSLRHV